MHCSNKFERPDINVVRMAEKINLEPLIRIPETIRDKQQFLKRRGIHSQEE